MKVSKSVRAIIGAVGISLISAIHTFAIEGIQLSVQSSNVLLSWPSATNETYIVQSLQALASTDTWTTLTDLFPAALNTNLTVFVASNSVNPTIWITNSGGGGTNGGGMIPPGGGGTNGSVSGYSTGFYRVVRDGVHIFGLTNGEVLSGTVQQPIEFAVDTTDEIVGVTFYDTNNNPVIGTSATPGSNGGWILNWDTSKLPNGTYAVEAELDFATNDSVVSVPLTVTVTNLFSFPNYLTQEFGSQMWIFAQTIPNATVDIDMYDENSNYLGSFYPEVSDGNGYISFIWDLTGGNGSTNFFGVWNMVSSPGISQSAKIKRVNIASPNFPTPKTKQTLVKKVQPAGASPGGSSGSTGPVTLWTQEPTWTPNNYWVVGVEDIGTQVAFMAVYGGSVSPQTYGGIIGTLEDLHVNMAPGNRSVQWDNEYIVDDPTTRAGLLAYLASLNPRYENFFWFGHGGNSSIGSSLDGTSITADQIAFALGNVPLSYSGLKHVALHPYRFVWCEACTTAAGNFCESFAIPAQDLSTNNFILSGLMSRAFLGYNKKVTFNSSYDQGGLTSWDQQSLMWNIFLDSFLRPTGNSLAALVYSAQRNYPPFQNSTIFRMDMSATSFGATDMLYPNLW